MIKIYTPSGNVEVTEAQHRTIEWMRRSRHHAKPVAHAVLVNLGEGDAYSFAVVFSDGVYRTVKLGEIHEGPL